MDIFIKSTFTQCRDSSEKPDRQTFGARWTLPSTTLFLGLMALTSLTLGAPARSQQQPPPPESVVDAARNARQHQANSANHTKIFTNDELSGPNSAPSASTSPQDSSSTKPTNEVTAPKPASTGCDNPDAERLKADLQAAQEEQDQLRRELSYNPAAISTSDVDMQNFKPGSSGLNVGGTPHIEKQPPSAAQLAEVNLEEKIASLTKALRIGCDSKEDGPIQAKLDEAEQQLNLQQRQFDLDHSDYYSQTNFAADIAGKAKLDAEQQQIQDLQSEIERLKDELAASKANPTAR